MSIYEHVTEFAGYPVRDFDPAVPLEDPANTVYRVSSVREHHTGPTCVLGCIGILLGVAVGIGYWIVTGKFLSAVSVAALVDSPLIERLRVLDILLGCLSDKGAEHLLRCPAVAKLEKLDIHYHFVSNPMIQRLEALGIEIDASGPQDPEGHEDQSEEPERYCAVGE